MPAWLQSLDSIVRAAALFSWLGVGLALLAALCGATALYLNREASARRKQLHQQQVAALTVPAQEDETEAEAGSAEGDGEQVARLQQQLEDQRQLLMASEERQETFLDRIEALQEELREARRPARPAAPPPGRRDIALAEESAPPDETAAPDETAPEAEVDEQAEGEPILSAEHRQILRNALTGKPSGDLTLVTIAGMPASARLAAELREVLEPLGWEVQAIQGVFREPPPECIFVMHSRESVPPTASSLSVALALVQLMSLPIKVAPNPQRPPGYLGLIVVPPTP